MNTRILEAIAREARFEEEPGAGIAVMIDIEDAVGLGRQLEEIQREIEDQI